MDAPLLTALGVGTKFSEDTLIGTPEGGVALWEWPGTSSLFWFCWTMNIEALMSSLTVVR